MLEKRHGIIGADIPTHATIAYRRALWLEAGLNPVLGVAEAASGCIRTEIRCGIEQADDLGVCGLLKILVVGTSRPEPAGRLQADDPLDIAAQPAERIAGGHRNREDQGGGPLPPQCLEGGAHRRPGRDTIIDDNDCSALDRDS
jgi:hypothetical protein